jgi:tagatose-1,6-bisphosphate aldolase
VRDLKKTNPVIVDGNCKVGTQVTQSDDTERQSGKARTELPWRSTSSGVEHLSFDGAARALSETYLLMAHNDQR